MGTLGFIIWQKSGSDEPENVEQPEVIESPVVETPVEEPAESEVPDAEVGEAVKLSADDVVSPSLFFQGDGIAYFNSQGQLFRTQMSISGNTVLLSNKTELVLPGKPGITKILWPQVGSSFIAESGAGSNRRWSYYSPDRGDYIDLPTQIKSLQWMPSGNKIMFVWVGNDGKATLNLSDPDTTNYQVLTDLYEPDNEIVVSPDGNSVLFYRTQTSDLSKNIIAMVSADGQTFRTVIRDGYNRGVVWSPDSQKFLYTKYNQSSSSYTVMLGDARTGESRDLNISSTDDKLAWGRDGQTIIIAQPNGSTDRISVLDLYTNATSTFDPGPGMDVRDMFTSLDGRVLFFRNAEDSSLYYLMLR